MATIAMTATVQAANVPPRVKLVVTDSGTPVINSVTVTRTDASGNVSTVRTTNGEPLVLYTSGANRTATIYDHEMPYGSLVTYSTVEKPATTVAATVDVTSVWLVDPGVPDLSVPVQVADLSSRTRAVSRGVLQPLGRRDPVVVTDGVRKGYAGTLSVLTMNDTERRALDALLDEASVLLLSIPASKPWGVDPCYVSFGDVEEERPSRMLVEPVRRWNLPYVVTETPAGGVQPQWNWAEVEASYTWTQAAALTWAQVLLGPNP